MYFELHMPYDAATEYESEVHNDYYKTEQDYVDALENEFTSTNMEVKGYASHLSRPEWDDELLMPIVGYNSKLSKGFDIAGFIRRREKPDVVGYSKVNVRLEEPNSNIPESIDSFVGRFAAQRPFLIEFVMLSTSRDGKFEEEMKQWWVDTKAILDEGKTRGGAWIDKVVPKKTMKVSFMNKSDKKVTFLLEDVEIEDRMNDRDYILFVKSMVLHEMDR